MIRYACPTLLAAVLLGGCFPFGGSQRDVVGPYRLEQWEDGKTYYLHDHHYDDSKIGGSVIEGIVIRIGWNDKHILAERKPFASSNRSGWMIVDVKSEHITGPFTDAQIATHAEIEGIVTHPAAEAWSLL